MKKKGFTTITDRQDRNILDLKKRNNDSIVYPSMVEFIDLFEDDIKNRYGEHLIYELDVIIDKIRMCIDLNSDE